jgi:outer membrane protein OmpA-like peptidoglycan-associated protein
VSSGGGAGAGGGGGAGAGGGGGAGAGGGRGAADGGAAAGTSAAAIEKALETAGTIDIYGIYFDFDSDRIKPESEPVLREIAKVMTDNPTWSLSVAGHTDNIGGDPYNLDLSKRRSASVKQALVTRYRIAGDRLETSGYGASAPKATNKTLEGRAQNRRVELRKN